MALNGTYIPHHVVDCGINIARKTSSLLYSVFVNYSLDLAEYDYTFPNDLSLTRNYVTGKTIADEDAELLEANTRLLTDEFRNARVDYYIDPAKEISLGQLKEYSAYSDFILADANENLGQYHLADLLVDAHCPVYLVSRDTEKVENIILTYDASFSCMRAIKSFSYLFPESRDIPGYLVYIAPQQTKELPRENDIKSWMQKHFTQIQTKILHGNLREELVNFTSSVPDSLVVMGSFGRSAMSRFFHKSLANALIEDGESSVFITHE